MKSILIIKRATVASCTRFLLTLVCGIVFMGSALVSTAAGQRVAKYGAEFLASGVGARALGMGGAYGAVADDVTAGYWNPAGLSELRSMEVAYMHAERFAGVVSFDYGGIGYPVTDRSTVALSVVRSGVNDIKNTLNAWDPQQNQPKPDPGAHITSFSAADYAFIASYGRVVGSGISVAGNGKIIRRTIGSFASAWGYSVDAAVRYSWRWLRFGGTIQDVSTMLLSWSVNRQALSNLETVFDQQIPQGGTEYVLPSARLAIGGVWRIRAFRLRGDLDLNLAVDGRRHLAANIGDVSVHPRMGVEGSYRDVVALRTGLNRLARTADGSWRVSPTVGAGLMLQHFEVDYGFGNFAGVAAGLGFTHRLSLLFRLDPAEDS